MNELTCLEILANDEGYEEGIEGRRERNPHAEGTGEHRAWEAGFLQGAADRRDVRAWGV